MHRLLLTVPALATITFAEPGEASAQASQELYDQVQGIYGNYQGLSRSDCATVTSLIRQIEAYLGRGEPVPAHRVYTVRFPNTMANPTIGDLARDRATRLQMQFESCFPRAPQFDPSLVAALKGTWLFRTRDHDFRMSISEIDGTLTATLDDHNYSYPPRFVEASSITVNGIGLRFAVGPEHFVDYQVFSNSLGVSGHVGETWEDGGATRPITMTLVGATPVGLVQGGFTARFYPSIASYDSSFNSAQENAFAVVVRNDPVIDFHWGTSPPDPRLPADGFLTSWVGHIVAPLSGTYTLTVLADDRVVLWIDHQVVMNDNGPALSYRARSVHLTAGQRTHLQLAYIDRTGGAAQVSLYIEGPNMPRRLLR